LPAPEGDGGGFTGIIPQHFPNEGSRLDVGPSVSVVIKFILSTEGAGVTSPQGGWNFAKPGWAIGRC